jgi:sugar O-acyltransferase (sialic acid O-acetyltransferase NeuD family)
MKKIIVLGSGGHAKVVIDILNETNEYDIIGITSTSLEVGSAFMGIKVIGDDSVLPDYINQGISSVAIGLGGFTDNNSRVHLYSYAKTLGLSIINAIHPKAVISKNSRIGEGVTIFPGVVINTEVQVGNNVIVATGSTIDHETIIEDHVLISAGVTVGAYALIKEASVLALGSKVISGITVGQKSIVAAGAVVVKNVPDNSRVFGIPAK